MPEQNYATDHRLDILVLGSMGDKKQPSLEALGQAVEALLAEPSSAELLLANRVLAHEVHVPNRF